MNQKDKLLLAMLSCGTGDLEMLEDVKYDWNEVLEQLDWPDGEEFGFNGLMRAVVDVGIIYIKDAADDRIYELETLVTERDLDEDEKKELEALRSIDPDSDIRGCFNFMDISVWIQNNADVYVKYLQEALDSFTDNTGLQIITDYETTERRPA